jgi:crotonobetainyl-CoA:carnitine CoA-transferase CaiB-like acyl-CoA transferase
VVHAFNNSDPLIAFLDGVRVVTTAQNVPGPLAAARMREAGARVTKIEPPAGDPFLTLSPAGPQVGGRTRARRGAAERR